MILDPRTPLFGQPAAAAITGLSVKAIDNYIQHGFVIPARTARRRLFSCRQIVRLRLVEQLGGAWSVPPKTGFAVADRLLALPACKHLLRRPLDVPEAPNWVGEVAGDDQVRVRAVAGGGVELASFFGDPGDAQLVSLVLAPQRFVRDVLWRCAGALAAEDAESVGG